MELKLSPWELADEESALMANQIMQLDGHSGFLLFWEDEMDWSDWVQRNNDSALGINVFPGFVPGIQMKATLDGKLVGRVSIRFSLNERLWLDGGHIGYYLLPRHRGQGLGKEVLRQSLQIAKANNLAKVLIICAESNLPSRGVAESQGGVLERVEALADGERVARYWIEI
ncbi:MAG: GNAT family N-acetyltransferase [Actinomycetota bacterium]